MRPGSAALPAVASVALALALGACGPGSSGPPGPPEIRYGVDECSYCRMIISEERHAAAATAPGGLEARFDDPGCLVAFLAAAPATGWIPWVYAGPEAGWRPAAEAGYLHRPGRFTPMSSGLTAVASPAEARDLASQQRGSPITWQDLIATDPLNSPSIKEEPTP